MIGRHRPARGVKRGLAGGGPSRGRAEPGPQVGAAGERVDGGALWADATPGSSTGSDRRWRLQTGASGVFHNIHRSLCTPAAGDAGASGVRPAARPPVGPLGGRLMPRKPASGAAGGIPRGCGCD